MLSVGVRRYPSAARPPQTSEKKKATLGTLMDENIEYVRRLREASVQDQKNGTMNSSIDVCTDWWAVGESSMRVWVAQVYHARVL